MIIHFELLKFRLYHPINLRLGVIKCLALSSLHHYLK